MGIVFEMCMSFANEAVTMCFWYVCRGDPSIVKLNIAITTGYLISGNYAMCTQHARPVHLY